MDRSIGEKLCPHFFCNLPLKKHSPLIIRPSVFARTCIENGGLVPLLSTPNRFSLSNWKKLEISSFSQKYFHFLEMDFQIFPIPFPVSSNCISIYFQFYFHILEIEFPISSRKISIF